MHGRGTYTYAEGDRHAYPPSHPAEACKPHLYPTTYPATTAACGRLGRVHLACISRASRVPLACLSRPDLAGTRAIGRTTDGTARVQSLTLLRTGVWLRSLRGTGVTAGCTATARCATCVYMCVYMCVYVWPRQVPREGGRRIRGDREVLRGGKRERGRRQREGEREVETESEREREREGEREGETATPRATPRRQPADATHAHARHTGSICTPMVVSTRGSGSTVRCMAVGCTPSLTATSTTASGRTTSRRATACCRHPSTSILPCCMHHPSTTMLHAPPLH